MPTRPPGTHCHRPQTLIFSMWPLWKAHVEAEDSFVLHAVHNHKSNLAVMILQDTVLRCTGTAVHVFRTRKRTSNTHTKTLLRVPTSNVFGQGTRFMSSLFEMDGESGHLSQLKRRRRLSAFWVRVRCAKLFTSSLGHLSCTQSHKMRTSGW